MNNQEYCSNNNCHNGSCKYHHGVNAVGAGGRNGNSEGVNNQDEVREWKDKLREQFCEKAVGSNGGFIYVLKDGIQDWELIEFISTLLAKKREEAENLKWKLNNHTHLPPEAHHEASIRNNGIDDVIKILS